MDLAQHFASYRASLTKDALEGYVEFAKAAPTKAPEKYPTVYDYVRHINRCLQEVIERNDVHAYKELLECHQEALILLFEEMVKESLKRVEPLLRNGYSWLKFSPVVVESSCATVIPRYTEKFNKYLQNPCISADELRLISIQPRGALDSVLSSRPSGSLLVGFNETGHPVFCTREYMNVGIVTDWAMELFR